MMTSRAKQKYHEKGESRGRDEGVDPAKMRITDAAVEICEYGNGDAQAQHCCTRHVSALCPSRKEDAAEGEEKFRPTIECEPEGGRKEHGEILGPAFPHLAETTVHARLYCLASIAEADGGSGLFGETRQVNIFQKR